MEEKSAPIQKRRKSVIYVYPGVSLAGVSLTLEDVKECELQAGINRRKHSISSEPGLDVKLSIQSMRPHTKASFSGLPRTERDEMNIARSSTDVHSRMHSTDLATYKASSSARRYSRLNEESVQQLQKARQRILKVII